MRASREDYQEFRDIMNQLKVWFGLSQKEVAGRLRVSEEMISRYVNEKCNLPQKKLDQAKIVLDEFRRHSPYLGIPESAEPQIGQVSEVPVEASDIETESAFLRLRVGKLIQLLQEHGLPLLSYAKAGREGFFEDFFPFGGADEYIKPLCTVRDPLHSFCLEVRGDSMEPRYMDGEIVVVCTTTLCIPKDFVLIQTRSGEVLVKQYFVRGKKILAHSLNPKYPDRTFDPEEITHMFKIIGSQPKQTSARIRVAVPAKGAAREPVPPEDKNMEAKTPPDTKRKKGGN